MGDEEDTTLEEFLEDAGIQPVSEEEKPKTRRGVTTRSLVGGEIEKVETKPEIVESSTMKLMKVKTITRTPEQRIANFELTNSEGRLFDLTIDEATARAIAAIFD